MECEVEKDPTDHIHAKLSVHTVNVLTELRQTGQLCDASLKVDGEEFLVHRAIMSACSPYFRALFTNDMFDTNKREVVIPGVSAEVMNVIVDYAYTREAPINSQNVEQLLIAADQFHVMGLVQKCCNYLNDSLSPENSLGIHAFSKAYFCRVLERASYSYLMFNFNDVLQKSTEYLQLTIDEVESVLSSDDLNVKNEELVFEAILRWINFDSDRRKHQIPRLLRSIRLGLLSTQYFVETVKAHPYVKENDACKPLVIETLKFLYDLDMDDDKEVDMSNPLSRPRVPHEILFVVGGWSGGSPTNVLETYDTRADRWIVLDTPDSGPRAYHGCATVNRKVYVIGGFDGMDYFNSCRCFDPVEKNWTEIAPMNARRCYVSVAVLEDKIYAMGGFDGHFRQNTAERYTPEKNQWSMIQPMNQQRSDASATTLNGYVYICGGFNGQECLSTAEYYDPQTNQWSMISPMRNRRSGISSTAYRGLIYALGGFNGITRMNTAERYNPVTNAWATIPEMYNPRSNFAVEVIDDMIFAIGGFNGVTTIYNVECFDATSDEWYDATDMNVYRSALSACVVTELPNVSDYIHKNRDRQEQDTSSKRRKN